MSAILLGLVVPLTLAAQDIALPDDVRRQIDAAHAGWKLAAVMPEVESEIRQRTPSWPPNLIVGDFDGNKQTDVAVLVEYPAPALPGGRAVQLLAFLGNGTAFTKFVLEPPAPLDPRQFLHLIRERGAGDAIGVEYEAIGGHAWSYRNGKWQSNPAQ
ncbi:MAG: hypothetical protein Q7R30_08985 [Acidobacteriota bacterium]|nr:hypothetical protein [Acidobacteriota bacterium]